jgi:hypothetical protein
VTDPGNSCRGLLERLKGKPAVSMRLPSSAKRGMAIAETHRYHSVNDSAFPGVDLPAVWICKGERLESRRGPGSLGASSTTSST